MKSIFEEMGGTYTLGEDEMYYPDLEKTNFRRSRQAVIMPVMRSH